MDNRPTSTSLAWFLLLALALHFVFSYVKLPRGSESLSYFAKKKDGQEKTFVIEQAPKLPDDRQIVQSSRAKPDESADDQKAKYAGEFRNRVKKETQSKRRGRFSEHTIVEQKGEGGESSPIEEPTERDGEEPTKPPSKAPGLAMRDLMAFSASPHALDKNVDEGEETVLNTDQVLYASFFNRIADEIYDTWVSHVREAFHDVDFAGHRLPPKVYFTRLNIQMNKEGTVTSITVLESSGVPELDDAAKKAFWEREPFLHPPEQMLGADGLMKIVYGFRADYRTSFFNISPWST